MGVKACSVRVGLQPATGFFGECRNTCKPSESHFSSSQENELVVSQCAQLRPSAMAAGLGAGSRFEFHKRRSVFHGDRSFAVIYAGPSACMCVGSVGAAAALMVSSSAPRAV